MLRDAAGNEQTIRTTDEHPFYVEGYGWLRADELAVGLTLSELDGSGDSVILASTREAHPEGVTVYNLEVGTDHTYFVADASQNAIWVHNRYQTPISLLRSATGKFLAKDYVVYYGIKDGKRVYVGITRQAVKDRLAQHIAAGKGFDKLRPVAANLTRREARAIEQTLIERNKRFVNSINSISTSRTWYADAMKYGEHWLNSRGK